MYRRCYKCHVEKDIEQFAKDIRRTTGTAYICKSCSSLKSKNHRIRSYGITVDEYNRVLESQSGLCAVCCKVSLRPLHIDHCHITGIVRGLLCSSCNRGIGLLGDSTEALLRAVQYLQSNRQ